MTISVISKRRVKIVVFFQNKMNTARGETSAREEYESNENELDEDEEEEVDDIADDSNRDTSADARHKSAMTGRGVSLSMLMADGVILPGEDCMSIEYLVCIDPPRTMLFLFTV